VEIFPAFDYARTEHETEILIPSHKPGSVESKTVCFTTKNLSLQLDVTIDRGEEDAHTCPTINFTKVKKKSMKGDGVVTHIRLTEGQAISFILRENLPDHVTIDVTSDIVAEQQHNTEEFWHNWIGKSKYVGRWREVVNRSLLILKLLTYEPTGAIIAAPTFSVPEDIGGVRYTDLDHISICDANL
jgi:GH15 family glucan-1,4-alpha-glucosidase